MKAIIIVPARLESTRLPNKVLEDIGGKPMLKCVLDRCLESKLASSLKLCTDNQKLVSIAKECGVNHIITSSKCKSGTDRIASVVDQICEGYPLEKTLIINVQGDQPFIDPELIDQMIIQFKYKNFEPEVMTPVYKLDKDSIHNPNVVKTIVNKAGKAIYFSRAAVPHIRDVPSNVWYEKYNYLGHVGVYGYRGDVISKWPNLKNSNLEKVESLEQLRFIDYGINIDTFLVNGSFLSVDTKDQLIQARNIALKRLS
tara:strand:- start:4384 stop:5151 length:768 start_codon:yes stop_codon:yes gene_type:complete